MQPSEALGTAAQVAVALAGFAGVVVVFRTESVHQWSATDKFRLKLLLGNSVIPLVLCLFGIFLLAFDKPLPGIWRWCSGFAAVILFPFAVLTIRSARTIPRGEFLTRSFDKVDFLSAVYRSMARQLAPALQSSPRCFLGILRHYRFSAMCGHDPIR